MLKNENHKSSCHCSKKLLQELRKKPKFLLIFRVGLHEFKFQILLLGCQFRGTTTTMTLIDHVWKRHSVFPPRIHGLSRQKWEPTYFWIAEPLSESLSHLSCLIFERIKNYSQGMDQILAGKQFVPMLVGCCSFTLII